MTKKAILQMAADPEIMDCMMEIAAIQSNMCHKTIYEQRTAKRRMAQMAEWIQAKMKGELQ